MLTKVSAATSSSTASKQISIKPSANNAVIYTVPAGKTFTGNAIAMSQMDFFINGVSAFTQASTPTNSYWNVPLTLVGGTVISNGPSYSNWILLGVEQ
jgi:hypothetical protein